MDINMQNNAYYNIRQKSATNQMISPNHYTKQTNNFMINDSKSPLRDRTRSNIEETNKKNDDNLNLYDKSGANTPTYAHSKKDLAKEP
jgi:hypothetical protein